MGHQVREPAMDNFHKLISLSRTSRFLDDSMKNMRQQSMVQVLTLQRGLTRTQTVDNEGGNFLLGNLDASFLQFGSFNFLELEDSMSLSSGNATDCRLKLPTEEDM